ncbi:MAG: YceD family protein [Burkholderiales bacterium]
MRYALAGIPEERGRPALRLKVQGVLSLVCQRCLGAMEFPLQIEVSLLLAASQAEVEAVPLDAEGPEQIVAGKEMPVRDLVEEEVLLAIPLAPRHERCSGQAALGEEATRSPFSALRGLVSGTKH